MFYYFGRKGRAAKSYPAPEYPLVIEPFAGSLAYTLTHRPTMAIGIEADERVVALWRRLTGMSVDEIEGAPAPVLGTRTSDLWHLVSASSNGDLKVNWRTTNEFMITHFERQRQVALKHHDYAVNSVLYHHGDYRDAPDVEACWFVDPPYQGVLDGYRHKDIDYDELAEWCLTRRGQVIICEGETATWLPFKFHKSFDGKAAFRTQEVSKHNSVEKVLTRRTHARCQVCSTAFPASRADARFCSGKCRMRWNRA